MISSDGTSIDHRSSTRHFYPRSDSVCWLESAQLVGIIGGLFFFGYALASSLCVLSVRYVTLYVTLYPYDTVVVIVTSPCWPIENSENLAG